VSHNDDNYKWLRNKMEHLDTRLDSIDITMTRNTLSLEEHVKRTNMLEERMKPVEKHVEVMNALAKLSVGMLGVVATLKALGIFN
jgi:hypothetical protein